MWHSKSAPELRDVLVDVEDMLLVVIEHGLQPLLEPFRLALVTPVSNQLDATAKLANGDHRNISARIFLDQPLEEVTNTFVGLRRLTDSLITFVSIKYTLVFDLVLYPFEICILANIGHFRDNLSEALTRGS